MVGFYAKWYPNYSQVSETYMRWNCVCNLKWRVMGNPCGLWISKNYKWMNDNEFMDGAISNTTPPGKSTIVQRYPHLQWKSTVETSDTKCVEVFTICVFIWVIFCSFSAYSRIVRTFTIELCFSLSTVSSSVILF